MHILRTPKLWILIDDEYIPGGSFVIGFEPMLVQKIVIHLPASEAERAISDIVVLGK